MSGVKWLANTSIFTKMDTEIVYDLLQVWIGANHSSFKECTIDTSDNVCYKINHVTNV
jgi:hypothetical protein